MMADDSSIATTKKYRVQMCDGRLFLHLANDDNSFMTVMELAEPNDLPAIYTRKMLLPLALIPSPTDVILIGLGGGQQAKYIHRYLPELRTIALEIEPEVVELARAHFGLPADDERLRVVIDDAANFVRNHGDEQCDLLLSDTCGEGYRPIDALHTLDFYRECHRILRTGGIMTVNVYEPTAAWADHFMSTVSSVFACRKFIPVSSEQGVMVLWKGRPDLDWDAIGERAARLDSKTGLGFAAFVDELKNE
jgi:spermidine synthase